MRKVLCKTLRSAVGVGALDDPKRSINTKHNIFYK